jgi:hypothetical protein
MNIYCVCSERIHNYEYMACAPPEPYCIAALVAAKSHSQAKYLAWQTDTKTFEADIRQMPRMSVHICEKDIVMSPGVITNDTRFQHCWSCTEWGDL